MLRTREVIVVGAGPSGLATAAMLERAGFNVLVLERTDRLAAPWHGHYDGLLLQSPAWMSHLPGLFFRRKDGMWVTRDAFIDYLARYVRHHALTVRFETAVESIERDGGGWLVQTERGSWTAAAVIVATGYNRVPVVPPWPGHEGYGGRFVHAHAYRNARQFAGEDVLVVGAGNSGAEIAYQLSAGPTRRVRLAVRTPPNVVPREALGMPTLLAAAAVESLPVPIADLILHALNRPFVRDLSRYGLPRPQRGIYRQYVETDVTPIIDTGFMGALRRRQIEPVAAVQAFGHDHVRLSDGTHIHPTAVIAATGYRRGLDELVGGLGVLAPDGRPVGDAEVGCPTAPGLYFIGYTHPFSGNLRRLRRDAPRLAREIGRYLEGDLAPAFAPPPAPSTPRAADGFEVVEPHKRRPRHAAVSN